MSNTLKQAFTGGLEKTERPVSEQKWIFATRGGIALFFGFASLFWFPALSPSSFMMTVAGYAFAIGLIGLIASFAAAVCEQPWTGLIGEAVINCALAAIIITYPGPTPLAAAYLLSGWAMLCGVALLAAGAADSRLRGMLSPAAATSLLYGLLILTSPTQASETLATWFGVYAAMSGVLMIGLSIQLRSRTDAD